MTSARIVSELAARKRIDKIKILVTDRCHLSCPYCFVPDTGTDMPWPVARAAADLLLLSRGRRKLISFFGGEPLLNLPLVLRAGAYARRRAAALGRPLTLSLITSGSPLDEAAARALARLGMRVGVSLAGSPESHALRRPFRSGRSSYLESLRGWRLLRERLPARDLGVSFCVFPTQAGRLERDFVGLLALGARYINFEIVEGGEPWTAASALAFADGARTLFARAWSSVRSGDFIHLNPAGWELARGRLTDRRAGACPFNHELKAYPDGALAFSHWVMSGAARERHAFASLAGGSLRRYRDCRFAGARPDCRSCPARGREGLPEDPGASLARQALDRLTALFAAKLRARAGAGDLAARRYIASARASLF